MYDAKSAGAMYGSEGENAPPAIASIVSRNDLFIYSAVVVADIERRKVELLDGLLYLLA